MRDGEVGKGRQNQSGRIGLVRGNERWESRGSDGKQVKGSRGSDEK